MNLAQALGVRWWQLWTFLAASALAFWALVWLVCWAALVIGVWLSGVIA